jgi:hypothetical protein
MLPEPSQLKYVGPVIGVVVRQWHWLHYGYPSADPCRLGIDPVGALDQMLTYSEAPAYRLSVEKWGPTST